jgi:hypothetical protein
LNRPIIIENRLAQLVEVLQQVLCPLELKPRLIRSNFSTSLSRSIRNVLPDWKPPKRRMRRDRHAAVNPEHRFEDSPVDDGSRELLQLFKGRWKLVLAIPSGGA